MLSRLAVASCCFTNHVTATCVISPGVFYICHECVLIPECFILHPSSRLRYESMCSNSLKQYVVFSGYICWRTIRSENRVNIYIFHLSFIFGTWVRVSAVTLGGINIRTLSLLLCRTCQTSAAIYLQETGVLNFCSRPDPLVWVGVETCCSVRQSVYICPILHIMADHQTTGHFAW